MKCFFISGLCFSTAVFCFLLNQHALAIMNLLLSFVNGYMGHLLTEKDK